MPRPKAVWVSPPIEGDPRRDPRSLGMTDIEKQSKGVLEGRCLLQKRLIISWRIGTCVEPLVDQVAFFLSSVHLGSKDLRA